MSDNKTQRVRATAIGFHDKQREIGDEFDVPAGNKASWYEPVDPPQPRRRKGKPAGGTSPGSGSGRQRAPKKPKVASEPAAPATGTDSPQ